MTANAFTLTQAAGGPDYIGTGRWQISFGLIPSIRDSLTAGTGGQALSLKNCELNVPMIALGQVRIAVLGSIIARPGHFDHQNRFQVGFYEDSRGGTVKTLLYWMNVARSFRSGDSLGNIYKYAVGTVYMDLLDTTGSSAFQLQANNVWPINVQIPPKSDDEGSPMRVVAEMSMDWFGLSDNYSDSSVATIIEQISGS